MIENQRRTSEIVSAYVRKNLIRTDQIAGLISSVHSTLSALGNEVVEEPPRVPAVSVRRSVHPDYLICIECGFKGKMLKRHLQSRHGLSVAEYRSRWQLSPGYSTTAAKYSERRSEFAKNIGLGRGRGQPAAAVPQAATTSETTPETPARRRASKAIKSRTSAKKASPKKTSPRTSVKKAGSSAVKTAKKASQRSPSRKPSRRLTGKATSASDAASA